MPQPTFYENEANKSFVINKWSLRVSSEQAERDWGWIRYTFSLTMKSTVMLNLCCVVVLVVFGRILIRWWAGPAAVPTLSLLLAMGAWALINGFMSVESCLLAALNRTREQAFLSIVAAGVNIVLSIVLVRHIGSVGVIGRTILSYLLVLVVPQSLLVRGLFKGELAADGKRLFAARPSLFAKAKFICSSPEIQNSEAANPGGSD
jgi:O-antigen/teichoic acid export membrane protein